MLKFSEKPLSPILGSMTSSLNPATKTAYATLSTIASLLEKEKNIREKECELLREKLNSARDKAENAPEDEELSHVAEFARALYEKARNISCA